jgi:hypothetical protein
MMVLRLMWWIVYEDCIGLLLVVAIAGVRAGEKWQPTK